MPTYEVVFSEEIMKLWLFVLTFWIPQHSQPVINKAAVGKKICWNENFFILADSTIRNEIIRILKQFCFENVGVDRRAERG